MKNYLSLISFLCILGCSEIQNPDMISYSDVSDNMLIHDDRSIDDAKAIALNAANSFSSKVSKSSLNYPRKVDDSNIRYYITTSSTKAMAGDTLMYIVNFQNEMGFALISKSRELPELIAFVEKGSYSGEITGNIGFDSYIKEISSQLSSAKKNIRLDAKDDDLNYWAYESEITEDSSTEKGPLVSATWSQNAPFNYYCPNSYPTGCVATAIALAMSAYKYPTSIDLSFPDSPLSITTLCWDEMVKPMHNYPHDETCIYCKQSALLLREIGHRVNMQYSIEGSATSTKDYASNCLNSFGYNTGAYKSYEINDVINSINSNSPVIIRAENISGEGHAWLIDGSKYTVRRVDTYKWDSRRNPDFKVLIPCDFTIERNWYLHMNYGWGEYFVGYYLAQRHIKAEGELTYGGSIDFYEITMFTGEYGLDLNVSILPNISINI